MTRKVERILCRIGGIWNIITGAITLFFYSPWVKSNLFLNMNGETKGLNFLSENINLFVMTFGLVFILVGSFNLVLATKIDNHASLKKVPIWFFIWGLISFFTVDIIGVLCYLPASFLIVIKNKSIRYANQ